MNENPQIPGSRKWKRYPSYKLSGVEWLGEVPEGWIVTRLKHEIKALIGGGTPESSNDEFWSNYEEGIPWVSIADMTGNKKIQSTEKKLTQMGLTSKRLKILPKGTLIYSIYASLGKTSILGIDAVTNQAILGILLDNQKINRNYLWRWLEFMEKHIAYLSSSNTQENLNAEKVRNMVLLSPPPIQQHAIATFLDRETARIDALIEKKERLIALLEEKRAALISHAVTKGLDPDAKMKESGVGWIGMVPDGWNQIKIKFLIKKIEQGWSPECETRLAESEEWGVLKVGCVNGGIFNENENKALPVSLEPYIEYEIKKGDILMSRANTVELLGSCAIVENVRERLLLCDKLYRITPTPTILESKFLVYFFASHVSRFQMEQEATGTSNSMKNIVQGTIRELIINLPPQNEQKKIVNYIDNCCHTIDSGINKIECSINLLHEYRSALISSAVTGKIDVRQEAAV